MKIFVGCYEIANCNYNYSNALRSLGHEVISGIMSRNEFYPNNKYDYIFDNNFLIRSPSLLRKNAFFRKLVYLFASVRAFIFLKKNARNFDLLLFLWGSSIPGNLDLLFLKRYKKKIVFINCGSEVRSTHAFTQEYDVPLSLWQDASPESNFNKKLIQLRRIEIFADAIFSVPDQSGLSIRPYYQIHQPVNDIPNNPGIKPIGEMIRITHCPTNKRIKGTLDIEKALNELSNEGYKFHYQRLENISNKELLLKIQEFDILIDQINLPGPGILANEAMSFGLVVMLRHEGYVRGRKGPPVVPVDKKTIKNKIKELLEDPLLIRRLSTEGPKYLKQHHSPEVVAQEIIDAAFNSRNEKNLHYPSFYLKRFNPPYPVSTKARKLSSIVLQKYGCPKNIDLRSAIIEGKICAINSDDVSSNLRWEND
jgi:hypothetical protein